MNDLSVPTPNIPLLRKAVEWAEAEAAKTDGPCMWKQNSYALVTGCGTAYCIAGYVAAMAEPGLTVRSAPHDPVVLEALVDGQFRWWDEIASEHLGITDAEADLLFAGSNTIERIRAVADSIAARAGERL